MADNKKQCYNNILSKIDSMEDQIFKIYDNIMKLKKEINPNYKEECSDVQASERAVVDAIGEVYADELLTRKPDGEA
jgi:hypothetical protein|tara:strand:+ start:2097 stop:2327 length:231 start_codon:yes stop_codon:yes gene_type:complete